jgi:hypothetical protein
LIGLQRASDGRWVQIAAKALEEGAVSVIEEDQSFSWLHHETPSKGRKMIRKQKELD